MICDWIEGAADSISNKINRITTLQMVRIIETVRRQFTNHESIYTCLWEEFVAEVSIQCLDGWKLACEFPEQHPIIFFRDGNGYKGYSVSSTESLGRILCETPGVEFYLTNETVDFVLCFNHHDYLIGVGKCKNWLYQNPGFSQ